MKKILVINAMGLYNYGGMAVVKGTIESLKQNMPNAELTIMSNHFEDEHSIYEKWNYENVRVINHLWYKEYSSGLKTMTHSGIDAVFTIFKFGAYQYFGRVIPFKNPYQKYDAIIDLGTDALNEHYGCLMPIFSLFNTLLAVMSRKPTAICAASIGTFENKVLRYLAKFVLNRVNLITAREETTKEYLQTLGINKPSIHLTADHAFLMPPASSEHTNEIFAIEGIDKDDRPLIGISPSQLIHTYAFTTIRDHEEKYQNYIDVMAKAVEYLVETTGGTVILIPHSAAALNRPSTEDDRIVSKKIYEKVKNTDKMKLIVGEYEADELKGIIGMCDMFIGCRMHPTIASTSMGVPTVAVVYGHKSHGIIGKMMGQEKCIIEIGNYDPDGLLLEMKSKIDYVLGNRDSIRNELKEKNQEVQEKALLNGKLVKELLDSLNSI